MKEFIIELPAKKEFAYVVQNKNTNCIFIRNYNNANITAGIKPYPHDVIIPPFRTGVISRPFPIDYIYLQPSKQIPVEIIEAKTKNPIDNLVQQEIAKVININLKGLEAVEISRDKKNNVDVFIHNAPKIGQKVIHPIHILHERRSIFCPVPFRVILRTGSDGRRIVNIFAKTKRPGDKFRLDVILTDDIELYQDPYYYFPVAARKFWFDADYDGKFVNISNNTFRNIFVGTGSHTRTPVKAVISAAR